MTIDPAEAYQRAAALLGETITELSDQEWDLPTSDEWTVVSTVAWVVVGDSHIATALAGGRIEPAGDFDAAVLGTAPVAAWRGTAVGAITALREPGALDRVVDHAHGRFAVRDLVGQRISENLVRSWDIGQAVGRPVEIPADLAEWCLDFWLGHADAVMAGGVLAEEPLTPAPDAGPTTRLLALMGRAG